MGCKCTNQTNEEDEIEKGSSKDEKEKNKKNNYIKNFNQDEDIFGLKNQKNFNQEMYNIQNNLNIENFQNINHGDNYTNIDPYAKYADYPEKIVELINNIRQDPVGYADIIEESIQNIIEEEDKDDPSNIRIIYKKKVKVALNRGEPAFREAIDILRSLNPLPPLEFSNEKCVPLPQNEEELKNPLFLREQVKKIREKTQIDVFFKDLIKIPEVSGLLMIVDDTNKNAGKKRMALLNKDIKYVGVTSKFIGKTFIAYFTFSK